MINVCHISSMLSRGDTRIYHKECSSLQKAGYGVYFVCSGESTEKGGIQIVGIGRDMPQSRIKRFLLWSRRAYQLADKIDADIYHIHDPELLPYALKLKRKGKKVVFDCHEIYPEQIKIKKWIPKSIRGLVALCYYYYESSVCKKLDAVVSVADYGRYSFQNRSKRQVIIENYPLKSEFDFDAEPDYKSNAVCYVGGLSFERGIYHLIKATYLAGAKLYLAGAFESAEFQKQCEDLPEYSCVEYCGFLDRRGIREILKKSAAGCSTLLKVGQYGKMENFPVKILEYMASGLPVIASDTPFFVKSIQNEIECGNCVDPEDIEKFARIIRTRLDDPIVARQMGERGRKAVFDHYNWDTEEAKLLELYAELSKGGR